MKLHTVVDGVPLGEGPVWCPDGTLVITHISPGGLRRIDPANGASERIASMPGGANAAQLASDGGFVVTQNGGIDFTVFADSLGLNASKIPYAPGTPGLQRVRPTGEVEYLLDEGFSAPNDLVVATDGTIFFTDPPQLKHGRHSDAAEGRFWAYEPGGQVRLIAEGFSYDNGVALSPEGRPLIVEGSGLLWIDPNTGDREWFVEKLAGESPGDGFCFDVEGRVYVCCPTDHCVRILDRDGHELEMVELGEGALPTNCCLGGEDGKTLFTTELAPGRVMALEGLPAPGLPLTPWPAPD
ncbi:SMP-30/gluconolactonase/LRE family protein [Myxococcota bacterium]|nr:SMP-30/gluconolactonase/LRE family protein [Myxococcota bacterium]